jgi:outer membrane immunogenic protein
VEISMNKSLGVAVAVALMGGLASAADIQRGPYVSGPSGAYNWVGPYVGANAGYQWGSTTNNPTKPSGLTGGVQAGYNWQYGQFVFGAETDLQLSGADDVFAGWKFSNPWFGTMRGRAGYAINNILVYGTLGLAYGGLKAETAAGLTESRTLGGWAGGLGMEVGFTPNWTARAEYLYIDLGDRNYAITGSANGLESSILRLGLNYRF